MASAKTQGTVLLVIGILILLVSLFADPLGIGQAPRFGNRQLTGGVMGAAFVGVGIVVRRRK